jgi:hypothetical protein
MAKTKKPEAVDTQATEVQDAAETIGEPAHGQSEPATDSIGRKLAGTPDPEVHAPPKEKPFASVVEFPAHSDASNYHSAQVVKELAQLGVEAQVVLTPPDGRTKQLLIDISASVQAATGVV